LGEAKSKLNTFNYLLAIQIIQFIENIRPWQVLRAIKTFPALTATVRSIRDEKHDPKFQKASAFGSMYVVATTKWAISFVRINEKAKFALHWEGIIVPGDYVSNRLDQLFCGRAT
jgi:hypothetical protein